MKRILTTFSKKWPEYLLEILVITVGILGAFTLNNWNEERNNRSSEAYYLTNLLGNIRSDSAQLSRLIESNEIVRMSMDSAIQMLQHEDQYKEDRFLALLDDLFVTSHFNQNRETFDNLLASGKIESIKNKSIIELLFAYYDAGRPTVGWDDANIHYTRNIFGPLVLKIGRFRATSSNPSRDDQIIYSYESFQMNAELLNSLRLKHYQISSQLGNYRIDEIPRNKKLCELIKDELN